MMTTVMKYGGSMSDDEASRKMTDLLADLTDLADRHNVLLAMCQHNVPTNEERKEFGLDDNVLPHGFEFHFYPL